MRVIVTVYGLDRVGIIYGVCKLLAEANVNILDISQTVMQEFFTMTMLVDLGDIDVVFAELQNQFVELSAELGVQITMQREEVFKFMYRL